MSEKRLLYFLFNRYTGLVKVGITNNIEHRVDSLEHAGGVPLDVLGTLDESCDLEIPIHNALFATRKCGEWFLPTDDLLAIAKAPSRPAIMALLEKYAPAVKQRERELLVIDEAKRDGRHRVNDYAVLRCPAKAGKSLGVNQEVAALRSANQQQEPGPTHPRHGCACYRFTGARECFSLRYRRDYIFGENYGVDEVCECPCHDEGGESDE
jgi:hypothetical protein